MLLKPLGIELAGVAWVLGLISSPVIVAQASAQLLEEVIVTARKRDEAITDVPETITAYSEQHLERAGIKGLDDLGRTLPNVVLSRRGDNEPNVVIRGIGSFGNVQGVGFYIDDVQNFTDQASRLVDLERVEVLKGPQGTLYGGSSIGGAVKYVTRKPDEEFAGKVSLEAGSHNTLNVNGSVNIPLSETVYARFSGYSDTTDGYLKNNLQSGNNDEAEEYGLRAAFRFLPSDETEANLSIRYSDLDNGGNDYYLTSSPNDYRLESNLDRDIFNRREILGGILNVQHQIDDLSFISLTSYTERENEIHWDLDYSPDDGVWVSQQRRPVKTKVLTQELRLQSDNGETWNWLVGAYYSSVRDRSLVILADVFLGVDAGGPADLLDFHDNTSLEKTYAGFGTVNYTAGAFEASLGVRVNRSDFYGKNRLINDSQHVKDTVVLPKLTLSYEFDPAVMVYFNVSEGYEPGRLTLFNETPLIPYKPEQSQNFELGAKGQTEDGFLTYEVAGFYIESTDRQLETLVLVNGVPNEAIGNVGDANTRGVEFTVTARPTDELSFTVNGGWMDSEFDAGLFDGFDVPFAPDFSGGASVDYVTDISSSLTLSLRADVSHSSEFYWDTVNTLEQESYSVFGARIALATQDDRWELAVRVDNLSDEKYHSELQPFDADVLARRGRPRTTIATVTYHF